MTGQIGDEAASSSTRTVDDRDRNAKRRAPDDMVDRTGDGGAKWITVEATGAEAEEVLPESTMPSVRAALYGKDAGPTAIEDSTMAPPDAAAAVVPTTEMDQDVAIGNLVRDNHRCFKCNKCHQICSRRNQLLAHLEEFQHFDRSRGYEVTVDPIVESVTERRPGTDDGSQPISMSLDALMARA